MTLKGRPLLNPLVEEAFLRRSQWFVSIRWRHPLVRVLGVDTLPNFALPRVARHDRPPSVTLRARAAGGVEPQFGLSVRRVEAVASKAFL